MLLKYDYLTKLLWREQDDIYKAVPRLLPVVIGKDIYYRRIHNPADCLTLYRYPLEELLREQTEDDYELSEHNDRMVKGGEVPSYDSQPPEHFDKFEQKVF